MKENPVRLRCPICNYGYMGAEITRDADGDDFDDEQMMTLDLKVGSLCGNLAGKPAGAKPCRGRLVKAKPLTNPIDLFNDKEAVLETFAEDDRRQNRKKWGPWRVIDTDSHRFLVFPLPSGEYSVPLCELRTDKGLREWLEHLHEKTWATPEALGWLVKAIFSVGNGPEKSSPKS